MNFKIKQIPEDFIVEEVPVVTDKGQGEYLYFYLMKKNYNTLAALKLISESLKIGMNRIGFAGNKDKNAVTNQIISIQKVNKKKVSDISIPGIKLRYYGKGPERIYTGYLAANRFKIMVRNISCDDCKAITANCAKLEKNEYQLANYFDEQRFGYSNLEIGRLLLQKQYDLAAMKIYRKQTKNAFVSLRNVHKSVLSLYVHAYQSFLFNEILRDYILKKTDEYTSIKYSHGEFVFPLKKIENAQLPLIGFGTEIDGGVIGKIIGNVLKKYSIGPRNFVIKQLPQITSEGTLRDSLAKIEELELGDLKIDELNEGQKKMQVSFRLGKGSYATLVVKQLTA